METAKDTFGTASSLPVSLLRKGVAEAEASSAPLVTSVPFRTQTDDQFNAQTSTHSSSTTTTDTQSTPQTVSSVHGATFMSLTPTALETTPNAHKTETSSSACSTATAPITPNTHTPDISASQMTELKTNTNTATLGISVQCRIAAITVTISQNFLVETKIHESSLYLGLRECGVNGGNATHVQLTVAWNECSTRLVHVSVS